MIFLVELLTVLSMSAAIAFVVSYSRRRWWTTPEGRHLMGTTLAIAGLAIATLISAPALAALAWAGVLIAMVYRLALLTESHRRITKREGVIK